MTDNPTEDIPPNDLEEAPTLVVTPANPPPKKAPTDSNLLQLIKILSVLTGVFIALSGSCLGGLGIIGLFVSPDKVNVTDSLAVLGILFVSLGFGTALAWHAGQAWRKTLSSPLRLPPIGLWSIIYILVLIGGQGLISLDLWPTLFLPPFHFLGALFPVVLILAVVKRLLPTTPITWRDLTIAISGGIFVAPLIAISVELIAGLLIFFISTFILALIPNGLTWVETWANQVQDPAFVENPANLTTIVTFPPVLITLIVVFICIGPIIEELTKPNIVYWVNYRHLTRSQVWLWGLAGGAGFALWENIFNTLNSMEAWSLVMVIRIGASLMHCLGSGLIALGWHMTKQHFGYLIGSISLSIAMHAMWNGIVIGIVSSALLTPESLKPIVGVGIMVAAIALLSLVMVMMTALIAITLRLAQEEKLTSTEAVATAL